MTSNSDPPDRGRDSGFQAISQAFKMILVENQCENVSDMDIPEENSNPPIPSGKSVSSFQNITPSQSSKVIPNNSAPSDTNKIQFVNNPKKNDSRYDLSDTGPFVVYVESVDKNIGNLHAMSIGKLIFRSDPSISNAIMSIDKNGRNRIKISFRTYVSANKFLSSSFLASNNLEAYIPQFLIRRRGVVRSVDLDISEEELKFSI